MSLFQSAKAPCPSCGTPHEFEVVASVNADRRPDLRAAILDGSFQRETCAKCKAEFVAPPTLTYFEVNRGWWILAEPPGFDQKWKDAVEIARESFGKAYGAGASAAAREIGAGLKVRVVFGWPALREKLLCSDLKIEDVELELLKMAIVRTSQDSPIGDDNELRLVGGRGKELSLAWIVASTERSIATLNVPRATYDEIAADHDEWQAMREEIAAEPFVDMNRLLLGD
ncbi:MAG: CpXC domain-containing protein [Caldimonas sp.]